MFHPPTLKENETGADFWDFGSMIITVLSKVPFIWIAHPWVQHALKKQTIVGIPILTFA